MPSLAATLRRLFSVMERKTPFCLLKRIVSMSLTCLKIMEVPKRTLLVLERNSFSSFMVLVQFKHSTNTRDVPDIHPVPGKCRISHYSVLSGPGKIMGPSNKKKNFFFTFFLPEVFFTLSKTKIMLRVKMFSRKSALVPGFTTILKCTPKCDGIVRS